MHCKLCLSEDLACKNIVNEFFYVDNICYKCRGEFHYHKRIIKVNDFKVLSFYLYDEMMQKSLIQYKQCFDECLYDIFLKQIKLYIRIKYRGYTIVLAPSSKEAIERRGFNHLYLMFKDVGLPIKELFEKTCDHNQMHSDKKQRELIKNYIKLIDKVKIPTRILLVDDVLTTGNTLNKCMDLLKNRPKKLKALTISYNKSWNIVKKGI